QLKPCLERRNLASNRCLSILSLQTEKENSSSNQLGSCMSSRHEWRRSLQHGN
ncbi:unnamed protein product, partial [Sphagnum jensenii]